MHGMPYSPLSVYGIHNDASVSLIMAGFCGRCGDDEH